MDFLDKYPGIVFPEPNTGCWLCVSSNNRYGYARLLIGARRIGAHRISYQLSKGSIPHGMEVDHLCNVSCCVNPEHLEVVTQAENKQRQARRRDRLNAYQCPNGHLRVGNNLYFYPSGTRSCRICRQNCRLRYIEKQNREIAA